MGDVIMSGSIIATIILCFVGIIKLPFKKFKEQHPTAYKIVFYALSLILAIGVPILCGLYMIDLTFKSLEFYVLIITTIAGVFGLYGTYEGAGLKKLVQTIVAKIKALCNKYSDSKLSKTIEGIISNVGIDKLNEIAQAVAKIKALCNKYSDSKLSKTIEGIITNVGMDKLNTIAQTIVNKQTKNISSDTTATTQSIEVKVDEVK